jgi:hypothetical protein
LVRGAWCGTAVTPEVTKAKREETAKEAEKCILKIYLHIIEIGRDRR